MLEIGENDDALAICASAEREQDGLLIKLVLLVTHTDEFLSQLLIGYTVGCVSQVCLDDEDSKMEIIDKAYLFSNIAPGVDRNAHWPVERQCNETRNIICHGCREEHSLPVTWTVVNDLLQLLLESKFKKSISFVEHKDLQRFESK